MRKSNPGRRGLPTVVVAGRRIDAAGATPPRFPLSRLADITIEVYTMLRRHRPAVVVSAAACGSDLIALAAARTLGIRRRIVLPFAPAKFRAGSVVDRPGDWGDLYDEMIENAEKAGDLVILAKAAKLAEPYTAANERLLEEAFALSGETPGRRIAKSKLCAVIVWEGRSRGAGDHTAAFADLAKSRGVFVEQILTVRG
jgi:hypothetical protein